MRRAHVSLALLAAFSAGACSASESPSNSSMGAPSSGGGTETGPQSTGGATNVPSGSGGLAAGGASNGTGGAPLTTGGSTSAGQGTFEWPEATADGGAGRLCKPGHYVGTYQCTVTGPMGSPSGFPFSGPVDLRLSESQEGEFLVVSGGTLKTSAGVITLDSGLVGKLDCQTGKFEGTLENGQLSIPPFPPGGTVGGSLKGSYAPATSGMDGTWDLEAGTAFPGYGCEGPWTITWMEP